MKQFIIINYNISSDKWGGDVSYDNHKSSDSHYAFSNSHYYLI